MSHDLLVSLRELDLRSDFDLDLSRSKNILFESSRRDKHDGAIADSTTLTRALMGSGELHVLMGGLNGPLRISGTNSRIENKIKGIGKS